MGCVLRRPPVCKFALRVKFRAAVVEAVTDLVPDRRTGRAVVGCSIRFRIEKRRVEDGGGKVEPVLKRKIKGGDRLRSHPPFTAIDGTASVGKHWIDTPLA